jgi:hypothetical protein
VTSLVKLQQRSLTIESCLDQAYAPCSNMQGPCFRDRCKRQQLHEITLQLPIKSPKAFTPKSTGATTPANRGETSVRPVPSLHEVKHALLGALQDLGQVCWEYRVQMSSSVVMCLLFVRTKKEKVCFKPVNLQIPQPIENVQQTFEHFSLHAKFSVPVRRSYIQGIRRTAS